MQDFRTILLKRLELLHDLPTLPEIVYRLEATAANASAGANEIAAVIASDPSTTAKILRLANSAYYRASGPPIGSLAHAVARLGLAEVRKVCLALAAMRVFVRPSNYVDHRQFWHHSLTVAAFTRAVARRAHGAIVNGDEVYIGGLLHEIGALVLDQYFDRLYSLVFNESARTQTAIQLIETEYLKIDHAEVGAWLLSRWKLPGRITEAVGCHHLPTQSSADCRRVCQIVHLADYICTSEAIAGPGEAHGPILDQHAWDELGIDTAMIGQLYEEVRTEAEKSSIFLSMAA